jgi:hydrogenase maturation protease
MKTIILGIGNPILGDDGAGIHIVRELKQRVNETSNVIIEEAQTGGMNLLDFMRGYDRAILVDAVCMNGVPPGSIRRFNIKEIETVHSCNPHDVTLMEAIDLSKKIGDDQIPENIIIIGVNLKTIPTEFNESLSSEIQKVVPKAVQMILSELSLNKKIENVSMEKFRIKNEVKQI